MSKAGSLESMRNKKQMYTIGRSLVAGYWNVCFLLLLILMALNKS